MTAQSGRDEGAVGEFFPPVRITVLRSKLVAMGHPYGLVV